VLLFENDLIHDELGGSTVEPSSFRTQHSSVAYWPSKMYLVLDTSVRTITLSDSTPTRKHMHMRLLPAKIYCTVMHSIAYLAISICCHNNNKMINFKKL